MSVEFRLFFFLTLTSRTNAHLFYFVDAATTAAALNKQQKLNHFMDGCVENKQMHFYAHRQIVNCNSFYVLVDTKEAKALWRTFDICLAIRQTVLL